MKDHSRHNFRWAPHTIGTTIAKPKDYELVQTAEAATPYALWQAVKDTDTPLQVGDILESELGDLRIYKYVGFEEAQWQIPEVKTNSASEPEATPPAETSSTESTPSPS
jgi:hypothetical protein